MGQGESKSGDEEFSHAASRNTLLRQYRSVNVDSSASESSYSSPKNRNLPPDRNAIDARSFVKSDKALDNVEHKGRIRSKEFSQSVPPLSTSKILEDYEEYANELINAPYNLQNRYTSNETVNFRFDEHNLKALQGFHYNGSHERNGNIYFRDPTYAKGLGTRTEGEGNISDESGEHYLVAVESEPDHYRRPATGTLYTNIPSIVITDTNNGFATEHRSTALPVGAKRIKPHKEPIISSIDTTEIPPVLRRLYEKGQSHESDASNACEDQEVTLACDCTESDSPGALPSLSRQGAVVVEVVGSGDVTPEASTVGRISQVSASNQELKLRQLCAIRDELKNLAKFHDIAREIDEASTHQNNRPQLTRSREALTTDSSETEDVIKSGKQICQSCLDQESKFEWKNDSDVRDGDEIYDDASSKYVDNINIDSRPEGCVKNLAKKFDKIATCSRESSPVSERSNKDNSRRYKHRLPKYCANKEEGEESIYEEYDFDPSLKRQKSFKSPKNQRSIGIQVDQNQLAPEKNQRLEPLVIETKSMVFSRKSKKKDRSRRKSDSSTSALSDSSATAAPHSSGKWRRRRNKADENGGMEQQWESIETEYQENADRKNKSSQMKSAESRSGQRMSDREAMSDMRQVFNRGIVLPVRRAPPGLSAQEVESESGATDMSAQSWVAGAPTPHHKVRMQNGMGYDDTHEHLHANQRSTKYRQQRGHALSRADKMRLSSQSSQYTSDIPVFHSPHSQHIGHSSLYRSTGHLENMGQPKANHHYFRQRNHYRDYASSGPEYGSLPTDRRYHTVEFDRFPAHSASLSPRYAYSLKERASSPDSYRINQRGMKLHSGYATSPESHRRLRLVATNAPHLHRGHLEKASRSTSSTAMHTQRSHVPRRSRASSEPRSGGAFLAYDQNKPFPDQLRVKNRSYSQDFLDHDRASHNHQINKKKMVRIEEKGKKSKKKSIDQRAKGVFDDIIDEAIDLLSPKQKRKSRSKVKKSKNSKSNEKNVVHTTNVFNEINEVDANQHTQLEQNANRTYRQNTSLYDQEMMRSDRHRAHRYAEDGLYQQRHKTSLLRPAPLDRDNVLDYTSSIRPVPGSGVTRDGSQPPPKSAYRNYDYELTVGQHSHQPEEKRANLNVRHDRSKMYASDSEYSASHKAHYRRASQQPRYPNVSFVPTRVKSEENMLSVQRRQKSRVNSDRQISPSRDKQRPVNPKFSGGRDYESEPENPWRAQAPILTRGLVTKIMHRLDDQDTKRPPRRPSLKQSSFDQFIDGSYRGESYSQYNPQWTNLSSPSSYSPKTDASCMSPSIPPSYSLFESSTIPRYNADLRPEQRFDQVETAHARFKLMHGKKPDISLTIPQQGGVNAATLKYAGSTPDVANDSKYGAFSNEEMIVADLVDAKTPIRRRLHSDSVVKSGNLFGTQPDVSMNKQQTLNLFLFNQKQKQEPVSDSESTSTVDVIRNKSEIETEMQEFWINHKGTQTFNETTKPAKEHQKENNKYVFVQQPIQQAPKHIETTHYITQQREIEKVQPEIMKRTASIQTERPRSPKPKKRLKENVIEVESVINKPVITESRHMEKNNYEPFSQPPTSPVRREIPVMYEYSMDDLKLTEREPSDDEETVILETTEIEEKEQRIQMSIFEEYEFSHKRVEDGKTVSVAAGEGEEIPIFWSPDKYEVVVDKKKKKSTQVKETTKEDEQKKASGSGGVLALGHTQQQKFESTVLNQNSGIVVQEGAQVEDTFTERAQENLAALEEVLERELRKSKQGKSATNVHEEKLEKPGPQGQMQEAEYSSYEKIVPLSDGKLKDKVMLDADESLFRANPSISKKSNEFVKRVHSSQSSSPSKKSDASKSSFHANQHVTSSNHLHHNQEKSGGGRDSYLSLFSAQPYVANRVYGRAGAIQNDWRDRVREAESDPEHQLNSHLQSFSSSRDNYADQSQHHESTPLGTLIGAKTHSQQSGPVAKTHFEEDADGNLMKVTEWEHKLTKTVEYPSSESSSLNRGSTVTTALEKLPEDGYIKMDLHKSPSFPRIAAEESNSEASTRAPPLYNSIFTEVTGETEIAHRPVQFETVENSLKLDDADNALQARKFIYDSKKAKLKPVKANSKVNGTYSSFVFGDTMSTPL